VNALDPPDALAKDGALIARAQDLASDGPVPPLGPGRDELLGLIAQASD
jgi:hypothetical protein